MRQQRIFTEEEKLLIVSLYINGKSSNTISKEFRTAPSKIMEIIKESGKQYHGAGRKSKKVKDYKPQFIREEDEETGKVTKRIPAAPRQETKRDPLQPPVGDVWKPWMIPTKVFIPEDESKLNWDEYAKDYDERKKICDERNALLRKKQSK